MTLTVARLYIEPTLKEESGPVGGPVVSDPMHPNGVTCLTTVWRFGGRLGMGKDH